MNILVQTSSGKVTARPDTTWERDNEDLFLPDFVDRLGWTPVLFAHVCKPGRSVAGRFAERYYDTMGYGVLLYPEDMIDGSEEGYACACCLDHSSFLPFPMIGKDGFGQTGGTHELFKDGRKVFGTATKGAADMIGAAIPEITKYCYIRTGDLIVVELQKREALCSRRDGICHMEGRTLGTTTSDFNIRF